MRVRALVYNVRGFRHGLGNVLDIARTADADLACITECGTDRSLRRFAEALGMNAASGPLPWIFRRAVRNAVLVRRPWSLEGHRVVRFAGSGYPRGATIAQVRRDDLTMTVAATHLGLVEHERPVHTKALLEELEGADPVVLGGDLNEEPGGPSVRVLEERFHDAWSTAGAGEGATYPARAPRVRIDALFVAGTIEVVNMRVIGGREAGEASDHLAVVAELEISSGASPA